jgi:hypothetical protein
MVGWMYPETGYSKDRLNLHDASSYIMKKKKKRA